MAFFARTEKILAAANNDCNGYSGGLTCNSTRLSRRTVYLHIILSPKG